MLIRPKNWCSKNDRDYNFYRRTHCQSFQLIKIFCSHICNRRQIIFIDCYLLLQTLSINIKSQLVHFCLDVFGYQYGCYFLLGMIIFSRAVETNPGSKDTASHPVPVMNGSHFPQHAFHVLLFHCFIFLMQLLQFHLFLWRFQSDFKVISKWLTVFSIASGLKLNLS